MTCPECREEMRLVWDENFGQMYTCKNGHSFINEFIDKPKKEEPKKDT